MFLKAISLIFFFHSNCHHDFTPIMGSIVHMGSIVFLSIHDVSISVVSFSIYPWFFDIGSIFYYISSIFRCGYYSSFLIIYDDSIWVVSIFIYPWYFDMDSIASFYLSFDIYKTSFISIYPWCFNMDNIVHFYLFLILRHLWYRPFLSIFDSIVYIYESL